MSEQPTTLTPGEFSRLALKALDASHGRTRKRKRDQKADEIGLAIKRDLLQRAAEEAPLPDEFEAWLMAQVIAVPSSGGVRAMASQILEEYRFACFDPGLSHWLRAGAPSDDSGPGAPKSDEEVQQGAHRSRLDVDTE